MSVGPLHREQCFQCKSGWETDVMPLSTCRSVIVAIDRSFIEDRGSTASPIYFLFVQWPLPEPVTRSTGHLFPHIQT